MEEAPTSQIILKGKEMEFNPEIKPKNEDISFDFKNFEIDEEVILKDTIPQDEYEEFVNEKDYQSLFEEYLDVKKSNINEVYANPLYFLKKIIYFYNKETFLDSYFLFLKSPPKQKTGKLEQFISLEANIIKDNKEACLSLDLSKSKFDVKILPDNKIFSLFYSLNEKYIKIPISNYNESTNELILNSSYKKRKHKELNTNKISYKNNDDLIQNNTIPYKLKKKGDENSNINNSSGNTNSSLLSSNTSKKNNNSSELSSKDNTLISYDEKFDENFNIIIKESNDNFLYELNKEKLGGENYESIANKTFELMINISLNRYIKVRNYSHKSPDKINSFFHIDDDKKINAFQIDTYIHKISGKELNKVHTKFPNNFFFFEDLNLNDSEDYEIIGEVSHNIINNVRQKFSQQFNYIHLIKEFNNYKTKEEKKFISLCQYYELNNIEKVFILFTNGSYIKTKFLIKILAKNKIEIQNSINQKKPKKDIINLLSEYLEGNKALDILDIDVEKFYYFCLFYNNLKSSGIKFCYVFISDIIEDKLENRIEEKIKLYIYNDKEIVPQIQIKEEKSERKKMNGFISKMIKAIKKNNKLRSKLMIITDEISRKIKEFVYKKNNVLNQLEILFTDFTSENMKNFFDVSKKIISNFNDKDLIKKIYLNKMYFFFIFLLPKEKKLEINKMKKSIKNVEEEFSFEIMQREDINDINKYISSKNIKNRIVVKIFISNNKELISFLKFSSTDENDCFFCFENNRLEIPISEIIKKLFDSAKNIYINEFYLKNKGLFSDVKETKEMLSQNNIIKKIGYDLETLGIKEENNNYKNIGENFFSFKLDKKNKVDLKLLQIGKDYYDRLIEMVKNLLEISKIKKDNNVMDFFINQKNFLNVFVNLMENIKCKCFYRFFWLSYIKKNLVIKDEFILTKIMFEKIIEKNEKNN